MKTTLLLAAAALCVHASAQHPWFQQDHSGNNIKYGTPVDIEFDGSSTVYSLHLSNPGMVDVRYDASTGAVIDVSYLTRGTAILKPVRVHTLGANYYILCNATSGTTTRMCLVSLNAATNAVNWSMLIAPPAGAASRVATDFVLDGGNYAYILSNAYDAVNAQTDVAVTKIDIGAVALTWDYVYQNTSRSENASNIIYRAGTDLAVSMISADLANPTTNRGPAILRIQPTGAYISSMLYRYTGGCVTAQPNATWIIAGNNNFYISAVSSDASAPNGPLWLAKINFALGITLQNGYAAGNAFLGPEIVPDLTSAGGEIVLSGSDPSLSGYVSTFFTTSALTQASAVIYPPTNPQSYGSPMFDVSTGPGLNLFSVAENAAVPYGYHLLKTSEFGDNGCSEPYSLAHLDCTMIPFAISFNPVQVVPTIAAPAFTVTPFGNAYTQPCYVAMKPVGDPAGTDSGILSFPNPTSGSVTLSSSGGTISDVRVFTVAGTAVYAETREAANGTELDLSGKKPGIYVVQLLLNGERKTIKVMLE